VPPNGEPEGSGAWTHLIIPIQIKTPHSMSPTGRGFLLILPAFDALSAISTVTRSLQCNTKHNS